MMTNTEKITAKLQIAAVMLMTAGWGWSGGNFTPQDAPIWNYLAHCIPIVLLLVLGLQLFRVRGTYHGAESSARGATIGISIFAVISIIGAIVMVVLGATNPDPNSVGVHSFADWFATILLNMGTFLWLATLIPARRASAEAKAANAR